MVCMPSLCVMVLCHALPLDQLLHRWGGGAELPCCTYSFISVVIRVSLLTAPTFRTPISPSGESALSEWSKQ